MSKVVAELPLDERIPLALSQAMTAAQVAAIRDEAEEALADFVAKADAADVSSLSPMATREQAFALRAEATEARWEADRMEASVAALSARAADLRDSERRAVVNAERDAATAERDELAAAIKRDYPRIVRELTVLAKRIQDSDARCDQAGIQAGAECLARGTITTGKSLDGDRFESAGGNMLSIVNLKIGMPTEGRPAWESSFTGGMSYHGLSLAPPSTSKAGDRA